MKFIFNLPAFAQAMLVTLALFIAGFGGGYFVYYNAQQSLLSNTRDYLLATARSAANLTDVAAHQQLTSPDQKYSKRYRRVQHPHRQLLKAHQDLAYIYTLIQQGDAYYFVLDTQIIKSGEPDDTANIMEPYTDASAKLKTAFKTQSARVEDSPYTDKWGTFLSAYVPLTNKGTFVGIIGVDIRLDQYLAKLAPIKTALMILGVIGFFISTLTGMLVYHFHRQKQLQHDIETRYEATLRDHRDHLQAQVDLQTQDLIEQRNRAQDAYHAKSEFLSNMSHELRTPMHAILNYAQMGLTQPEPAPKEKTEKYFRHIHLAGSRLLELLNNLLDLAKMESGKMSFSLKEADFLGVIDQSLAELDSLFKEKGLHVNVTHHGSTHAMFDMLRMIQVVINILSNAIRYSPVDGVIDIRLSSASDALSCSITNQGEPIPHDEIESIFAPFIQSSATKTGAGGTGLGLSICREIMDAHNGKIWAENITDLGVAFHILIPKHGL